MNPTLVNIKRADIDPNDIQGFVLDESNELILVAYIYDFRFDGFTILHQSDITEINSSKTDIFQTDLLKDEGVTKLINFSAKYNLKSWQGFIVSALEKHDYFIFDELVKSKFVKMKPFMCAG